MSQLDNERMKYMEANIYGHTNRLMEQLMESGAIEPIGSWSYEGEDDSEGRDILTWWVVSEDLASRLKKAGYCVVDYEEEIYFWGCTSTGQAFYSQADLMKDLML